MTAESGGKAADTARGRTRAAPMPPEQRREAIIAATVPLVRRHGFDVSTRQIAEAADVAEGTIFRVFDDKETLLRQAVYAALDPSDMKDKIRGIGADLPLEERVRVTVELFQQWMVSVVELATAVGRSQFPHEDPADRQAQYNQIIDLVATVFEPDREHLRYEPVEAARLLQIVAFGGSHPRLASGRTMTPDEIVDLLLNGIRAR